MTLIHVCCAPDLLSTVLKREFPEAVFYFYNPNIFPESEYEKRLEAFKTVCHRLNLNYMEGRYDPEEFSAFFERYFDEEEGGARCGKCMEKDPCQKLHQYFACQSQKVYRHDK